MIIVYCTKNCNLGMSRLRHVSNDFMFLFDGVFHNYKKRPKGIEIDDAYLESISPDDLCADITAAMQDAHSKSTELMQKKIQSLYSELGLPNL